MRYQRPVNFHSPENFSGLQIAWIKGENRNIVTQLDELAGYIFRIGAQTAHKLRRIFPNEKSNPQPNTLSSKFTPQT
jgi:hypothetical protein